MTYFNDFFHVILWFPSHKIFYFDPCWHTKCCRRILAVLSVCVGTFKNSQADSQTKNILNSFLLKASFSTILRCERRNKMPLKQLSDGRTVYTVAYHATKKPISVPGWLGMYERTILMKKQFWWMNILMMKTESEWKWKT